MNIKAIAAMGGAVLASLAPASASAETPAQSTQRITNFVKVTTGDIGNRIPPNTYTKLEITAELPTGEPLLYSKRNFLMRIGLGKKYTFSSVLRAEAGLFRDTVPLVSRDYESSSRAGETFARTIGFDAFDFPYFLSGVDSTTQVGRFSVSADMVETTNSQISSLALGVMRNALKAVAPASGIVTTLTQESSDAVANRIDEQTNMLFGTTAGEDVSFDVRLSSGQTYDLTVYGPLKELDSLMENRAENGAPIAIAIGRWTISFATAKPSIFSEIKCKAGEETCSTRLDAYLDATSNPASVLAYKLVEQINDLGRMQAYLQHQEWWGDDLRTLETQGSAADPGQFCRKIRSAVAELGLNDLDGRIVAASVGLSGLVSENVKRRFGLNPDCKYPGA